MAHFLQQSSISSMFHSLRKQGHHPRTKCLNAWVYGDILDLNHMWDLVMRTIEHRRQKNAHFPYLYLDSNLSLLELLGPGCNCGPIDLVKNSIAVVEREGEQKKSNLGRRGLFHLNSFYITVHH